MDIPLLRIAGILMASCSVALLFASFHKDASLPPELQVASARSQRLQAVGWLIYGLSILISSRVPWAAFAGPCVFIALVIFSLRELRPVQEHYARDPVYQGMRKQERRLRLGLVAALMIVIIPAVVFYLSR